MADGGLLLGAFCVCAVIAVIPTALCAAAMFGAPPQPSYLAWQRRPVVWRSYGAEYYPGSAPPCGSYNGASLSGNNGSGSVFVRVPAPSDGTEYLVVRADVFEEQQQPRQRKQPDGEGAGASESSAAAAPSATASASEPGAAAAAAAAAKEE
jgi:hypothetical protein